MAVWPEGSILFRKDRGYAVKINSKKQVGCLTADEIEALRRDAALWRAIANQDLEESNYGQNAPFIQPGFMTPIARKFWALTSENAAQEVMRTLVKDPKDQTDTPPVEYADEVRAIYNRVIQHAINLGMEAGPFLSCWTEGDWDGCREFNFEPNERQPPKGGG